MQSHLVKDKTYLFGNREQAWSNSMHTNSIRFGILADIHKI